MNLLFLPGFMCDERLFSGQIRHLEKLGYSCHFIELDQQDSIEDMADYTLSRVEGPLVLVGLSMGGIVALEAIGQAPERVVGLCLLNSTPFKDSLGDARLEQIVRVHEEGVDGLYMDVLKPQYIASANRQTELMDMVIDMARSLGSTVFERQSRALAGRDGYEALLMEISPKVLLLTGSEDAVCGLETAQFMKERIKNAALTCLPNCGHLSSLEQSQMVTNALVTFLERL